MSGNINVTVSPRTSTTVRFAKDANSVVLRNEPLLLSNDLGHLNDVVLADTSNGNILVYDSSNSSFVLESPNYMNLTEIDGGSF